MGVPKHLEERNAVLFDRLIPDEGKCETLEGEMLRAVNRMLYRYYNDGDMWFDGYGCETVGPAEAFLRLHAPIDLRPQLNASDGVGKEEYEYQLTLILEKVLDYIESRTQYTPNYRDMFDSKPKYKCEYEEEDC